MSDGIGVLSSSDGNSTLSITSLTTDSSGNIVNWRVSASTQFTQTAGTVITTCFINSSCDGDSTQDTGFDSVVLYSGQNFDAGTWTTHADSPPPTTVGQFFAHIADGGQGDTWQTDFLLVNPSTSTADLVREEAKKQLSHRV